MPQMIGNDVVVRPKVLPLMLWIAALLAVTTGFHALGSGPLAPPPLAPERWLAWVEDRGPLVATIALLRLVVLAMSWYLVVTTSIGVLARVLRAARLVRITDALSIPVLRRLLHGALGVSLATAILTAPSPSIARGTGLISTTGVVTLVPLPGSEATRSSPSGEDPTQGADHRSPDRVGRRPMPLELLAPGVKPEPVTSDAEEGQRVVRRGDSLWSIASAALAEEWGRHPTEQEVIGYWEAVIERNRGVLADPGNPDLIFPGQVVELPMVPGGPEGSVGVP